MDETLKVKRCGRANRSIAVEVEFMISGGGDQRWRQCFAPTKIARSLSCRALIWPKRRAPDREDAIGGDQIVDQSASAGPVDCAAGVVARTMPMSSVGEISQHAVPPAIRTLSR